MTNNSFSARRRILIPEIINTISNPSIMLTKEGNNKIILPIE
jgi:hypothetical protein